MTQIQILIVGKSSDCCSKLQKDFNFSGSHIVMPIAIGIAGSVDYLKLPLSAIEELVKGILLLVSADSCDDCSKRRDRHFQNSLGYANQTINKLLVGWVEDLKCAFAVYQDPFSTPNYTSASYYGSNLIYRQVLHTLSKREINHPSLCPTTM